jgi:transmembrane sensor
MNLLDGCMDDELLFRSATARTTPAEERAVVAWLERSDANQQSFRETLEILRLAADADDALALTPAPSARETLSARAHRNGPRPGRRPAWWVVLVPAAVVAGVALVLAVQRDQGVGTDLGAVELFGSDEFLTEAEPATVGLRDGTVVRLAPESRLRVHARQAAREVSLDGRGYFAVASDPESPFTVHSPAGTVTVLGTRFDVTVAGEDLRVIVIEGSVRLTARGSQVVVRAGQLAQVLKGNLVPPVDVPDPASMIGWVGNFIAFHNTPLPTVAREIEQRFGLRVELSEGELRERTVTALFAGRSYEEIAEVICVVANLRCTRRGDVLRMTPVR